MPLRPLLLATAMLIGAAPAIAQVAPPQAPAETAPAEMVAPRDRGDIIAPGDTIDFAADTMSYDDSSEIVTASGGVQLARDAYKLTADQIEYNRKTGVVIATGHVISVDPEGNQAFGDRVELTDSLRDGAIENVLFVLNDGGRLAAATSTRKGDILTLGRAVYSPCAVVDSDGCPHSPVWQVKAVRVVYNRARHRLSYRQARLEMFGFPVIYLPSFSHPDGEAKQVTGILLPEIQLRRQLGLGIGLPFHIAQAPDRDMTITPYLYTAANPALKLSARRLFAAGPIQFDAFFTYSQFVDYAADGITPIDRGDRFRGYFGVHGQLQHSPEWRSTFSVRLTTDDTFNRLYSLDYDDSLRSTYALERIRPDSYLSISAWAFQGLRATDRGGEIPFVLPLIEYDWRPAAPVLGGRLRFGANSLVLERTNGQSIQRGLAYARWDRSVITGWGQRITATGMVRGDLYNVVSPEKATFPDYAGQSGVHGRAIPLAALDIEWPLAGPFLGGTQTITPRAQLVAAPNGLNNDLPNEDSRAIDLDDTSLFDLNRYPGYDRFEGGTRLTYGVEYKLDRPGWALRSEIGQSVRLQGQGFDFPAGTGLSGQLSDFVGRTNLKFGSILEVTHRFRVDRATLAVRRNEFDVSLGSRTTYVTVGYLKLNRNVQLEDLTDRSELDLGGRVAFAHFWSAYASAIIDLTTARDDPTSTGNGFQAIRHRFGVEYEDECFRFGLAWRRDYITDRDIRAGNTFQLSIAFKTLSR